MDIVPQQRSIVAALAAMNGIDDDDHDDDDENDLPLVPPSSEVEEDLVGQLASTTNIIRDGTGTAAAANNNDDENDDTDDIPITTSEESNNLMDDEYDDEDVPTPEGFFIGSSSSLSSSSPTTKLQQQTLQPQQPLQQQQQQQRRRIQQQPQKESQPLQRQHGHEELPQSPQATDLPSLTSCWPLSKPKHQQQALPSSPPRSTRNFGELLLPHSSCPRQTTTTKTAFSSSSSDELVLRPMYTSSSMGALLPPTTFDRSYNYSTTSSSSDDVLQVDEPDDDNRDGGGDGFSGSVEICPANRAAAAMHELECSNHLGKISELREWNEEEEVEDISRQETFRTGNVLQPRRQWKQEEENNNDNESRRALFGRDGDRTPLPPRTAAHPTITTTAASTTTTTIIPSIYTYTPHSLSGRILTSISCRFVPTHQQQTHGGSALAGFFALLLVTCANYMLGPMRDAAALAVGVSHIPALTLASTVLALGSSVPVGWLFEAPDPRRRRLWKRMGLTRGETQGTSLALFYRVFAFLLLSYALGFKLVDQFGKRDGSENDGEEMGMDTDEWAITVVGTFFLRLGLGMGIPLTNMIASGEGFARDVLGFQTLDPSSTLSMSIQSALELYSGESIPTLFLHACKCLVNKFGEVIYIMFFLVVHLMKLHSLSLIWGVTMEAMEYEENAEKQRSSRESGRSTTSCSSPSSEGERSGGSQGSKHGAKLSKSAQRLKRLGFVGFGGTLGGILGSVIASFAAHILHMSGLLIVAAILLEISANLSVELGRIMQRHWEEQMRYQSCDSLASLASSEDLAGQTAVDSSMRKSASLGSMKRVASGSLSSGNLANLAAQQEQQERNRRTTISEGGGISSATGGMTRAKSVASISIASEDKAKASAVPSNPQPLIDDNSFKQRLLRGITTILRSRLLMAIFTYNALYASTSVLLSFQRAELVANRSSSTASAVSNTAFLAKINTASSVAVFALQASGLGAYIATFCGQHGALALMPIIRLCGVALLGWWHLMSKGKPPDLIMFLVIDEFTKVINFAIAKPVRENLWRGLSAEARYEAKPIVDTLANRWGGGSAAFLVSFINGITDLTGLGVVNEHNGERSILGFPPVLLLCMVLTAWWTAVSADIGNIRHKIDLELKKQQ